MILYGLYQNSESYYLSNKLKAEGLKHKAEGLKQQKKRI
ncbi:hypothetical protein PBAC_01470 [Pedobacter glucosidilyticus]|nr:hypothetical protein PBAC_01470 [Pedobacter glucosidilyticus]